MLKSNGTIQFNTGSAGSVVEGIDCSISISVDNITVKRCKSNYISFDQVVKNILITQNYVYQINHGYNGKMTNSVISNNILGYQINTNSISGVLQVINNVVFGTSTTPISVFNSTVSNNIVTSTSKIPENTGNIITNNILGAAGTNENGNKYNVAMTTVFVDYSGSLGYSDDAKWKLEAGSPAIGTGVSGVDCGVFGGVDPYVLSGVPALPHIYEATIPGAAYSDKGLSCTIKVKSGK